MQAITTTFKGPTEAQGSRIVARCQARRKTTQCDDELSLDQNHREAALALATALEWHGWWVGATLPDGRTQVFVHHGDLVPGDQAAERSRGAFMIPRKSWKKERRR